MLIEFPYEDIKGLDIDNSFDPCIFNIPSTSSDLSPSEIVLNAINNSIGSPKLSEIAKGKEKILIVSDDIHRPTPVHLFVGVIIESLLSAGVKKQNIEFMMALGTHRAMTKEEMIKKLGPDIVENFKVHNHQWDNPDALDYMGDTDQGVPVWVNKKVKEADLVIGLGAIMPIEVCGFTGGGKILVPGVCGEITNSEMHWTRVNVSHHDIIGKADNPIRASIDELARKAGLDYIVNVIVNEKQEIVRAVAGDMHKAHRAGCQMALDIYGVKFSKEYDIVIADGYPFDIEFWQVNKALDTAGNIVKKDGVVIIVSPCHEGFSQTHGEILEFGYTPIENIKRLVNCGKISHKVVGVHMIQVSTVAVEKAKVILVSTGISKEDTQKAGLLWAPNPQAAFEKALKLVKEKPDIAILKNAARMLPLMNQ